MSGRPTWGQTLRVYRRMAGLTQEELARAARLGVRTIRDLERGRSRPRGETVRLLAVAPSRDEAIAEALGAD